MTKEEAIKRIEDKIPRVALNALKVTVEHYVYLVLEEENIERTVPKGEMQEDKMEDILLFYEVIGKYEFLIYANIVKIGEITGVHLRFLKTEEYSGLTYDIEYGKKEWLFVFKNKDILKEFAE